MTCPYFKGNAICLAHRRGLYVPAKDVEISLCTTDAAYGACRIFIETTGPTRQRRRDSRGKENGPEKTAPSLLENGNRSAHQATRAKRGPDP